MHIDAAEARRIQQGLRQDEAVGDDHQKVCAPARKLIESRAIAQRQRLRQRQACRERRLLHGTGRKVLAAPTRPIRSREDSAHAVPRAEHGLQHGACEFRRSRECNAQRGHSGNPRKARSVSPGAGALARTRTAFLALLLKLLADPLAAQIR